MKQYIDLRDRYLMAQVRHQLYETPIVFERGEMELLYDTEGKEYVDCFSGIMVVNFGHCNPEINEVLRYQAGKLQHTSTFFLNAPMLELAEKLARITPEGLQRSYFVNSGSEAVDGAILLARFYTGNDIVIPVRYGYHGRTLLCTVCSNTAPSMQIDARADQQDISFANNGYCYRCPLAKTYPGCGLACTGSVEEVIQQVGGRIAAILVEPIQGVGGVITPPDEWLKRMEELAHAAGGLLIVDEVQSGFGRTGRAFYTNQSAVRPDIMTMAKGMANGIPAGAFIATDEIGEAMKTPTYSTFGGNPLSSAVALACIRYMEDSGLYQRVNEAGDRFRNGLEKIRGGSRYIGDIRGEGLFIGLELVEDPLTKEPAGSKTLKIIDLCSRNGLIVGKSGPKTNVIRIGPPLTIRDEYIDRALAIMEDAFNKLNPDD